MYATVWISVLNDVILHMYIIFQVLLCGENEYELFYIEPKAGNQLITLGAFTNYFVEKMNINCFIQSNRLKVNS